MKVLNEILSRLSEWGRKLHAQRWNLLPVAAAGLSIFLIFKSDKIALIIAAGIFIAGATSVLKVSPKNLIRFYFVYLILEGAFKLLTNYNPLVHVGSDLILVVVFVRLLTRFTRERNQDLTPQVKDRLDRLTNFIVLFWVWVAVQFFNPWGLGLLPSLAGLKIYAIPLLMFFIVGYLLREDELVGLPRLILGLGLAQAMLALADWYIGPEGLPALHPKYGEVLLNFLQGAPYRPFGTTNLPGAPSIWMFNTLTAALIVFYRARRTDVAQTLPRLWQRLFVLFVPLAGTVLLVCQVRLALVRFFALACLGLAMMGRRSAAIAFALAIAVPTAIALTPTERFEELMLQRSNLTRDFRFKQAFSRISTLTQARSWVQARGDGWALQALKSRAEVTLSGIGLSRLGAAATPWLHLIERDRYFKADWSFSDNLILAIFTELGAGGLIAYGLLVLAVLYRLVLVPAVSARIAALGCLIMVLSGLGSEGILFQPDASFFWFYVGFGLRATGEGVSV